MRVGLLGTGPWAEIAHAPALAAHEGVEFVGIWGRRAEAVSSLADRFGTRPYHTPDELIRDAEAIAIALPPAIQAPLAARAARAGCHLLLEKPLAMDVVEARSVTEALDATGCASVVFLTTRFTEEPGRWIGEQARRGGWFTAQTAWLGSLDSGDNPFAASPWRREKNASLWDVGPHALSVLLPVLGEVPEVTATACGPGDTVQLLTRHAGGASSAATLGLTAPVEAAGVDVLLRGSHGTATMPQGDESPVVSFGRAIDALTDAAATGVAHACDARFGLRIVEILAAAERALSRASWERTG